MNKETKGKSEEYSPPEIIQLVLLEIEDGHRSGMMEVGNYHDSSRVPHS